MSFRYYRNIYYSNNVVMYILYLITIGYIHYKYNM